MQDIEEECYYLSMDMEEGDWLNVGGYQITYADHKIQTDRSEVFEGFEDRCSQFASPEINGSAHLDIYVGKNIVEVYINDGEYVISNVVYGIRNDIIASSRQDDVQHLCCRIEDENDPEIVLKRKVCYTWSSITKE